MPQIFFHTGQRRPKNYTDFFDLAGFKVEKIVCSESYWLSLVSVIKTHKTIYLIASNQKVRQFL